MQSNLAVEESCICGTHQLFHQQLLSQNCIYKINFHGGVPCTLRCELVEDKTLRLPPGHERWFTEVFHYSTMANILDNVQSAAALWGEIECSIVYNVLPCAMYVSTIQQRQMQTCDWDLQDPTQCRMEMFKLVYNHPPTPPLKYHNILAIDSSTCPTVELWVWPVIRSCHNW